MKLVLARELVDGTPRGVFNLGEKRAAWEAAEGLCFWCGEPVLWLGSGVEYDHRIPLALNGEDTVENLGPIHPRPCHKAKTAQDIRRIAKAKRQRRLIEERRPSKRPIKSRGFAKLLTRGFDGVTRRRGK